MPFRIDPGRPRWFLAAVWLAALVLMPAAGLAPATAQPAPGAMPPGAMMPGMGQGQILLLTDDMVRGFIDSYPAVHDKMDELEQQYDLPQSTGRPSDAWQGMLAYRQVTGQLDGLVGGFGFGSYGEWVQAAMAIAMAHAFAAEGGGMDQQMADAIARVQNDPNMPAAQKQMILQQIQAQSQMMAVIRPPEQNLATVNRFAAELDQLFEND